MTSDGAGVGVGVGVVVGSADVLVGAGSGVGWASTVGSASGVGSLLGVGSGEGSAVGSAVGVGRGLVCPPSRTWLIVVPSSPDRVRPDTSSRPVNVSAATANAASAPAVTLFHEIRRVGVEGLDRSPPTD